MKDLSRRDLNEFANSKKVNPLIFIAASIFGNQIERRFTVAIMPSSECNFEKISGVTTIFRITSSYVLPTYMFWSGFHCRALLTVYLFWFGGGVAAQISGLYVLVLRAKRAKNIILRAERAQLPTKARGARQKPNFARAARKIIDFLRAQRAKKPKNSEKGGAGRRVAR